MSKVSKIVIPMDLIALLLIVAKLKHMVSWSWTLVLAPLWLPFALTGIIIFGMVLIMMISLLLNLWGTR